MTWFVRVKYEVTSEWIEGPFKDEEQAMQHMLRSIGEGRTMPRYNLRPVRLERPDAEHIVGRLADWIEANCEGVQVYRDTGLVIS